MEQKVTKNELDKFRQHCQRVADNTQPNPNESLADKQARINRAKKDYNYFVRTYLPHYAPCDCAPNHIKVANELKKNRKKKIAWEAHRGFAKSVHSNVAIPLWLKMQGELKFMVLIGENADKAKLLLSDIQAELQFNGIYTGDFGEQVVSGSWSEGDFQTRDGCYFKSLGIGQDPAGLRKGQYRPCFIVVDDVDTLLKCNNTRILRDSVEWITSVLMGCYGMEFERFIIANNRIADPSILTLTIKELSRDENFTHYKINCVDKDGNPTWPARYTKEYWQNKEANDPPRAFQRKFMNNPIKDGTLFSADWIFYKSMKAWNKYTDIVGYWDLSYKKDGDFKAFALVGNTGTEYHVLDIFCRQCAGSSAAEWLYDLDEHLQGKGIYPRYFFEGNANQNEVFAPLFDDEGKERGWYVPIHADTRQKGNKFMRVEATLTPLFNDRKIFFASTLEEAPDALTGIDQILSFGEGSGAHDDFPDTLESAIFKLMRESKNTEGTKKGAYKMAKREVGGF